MIGHSLKRNRHRLPSAVLAAVLVGCGTTRPPPPVGEVGAGPVPRAGWDPTYFRNLLDVTWSGESGWTVQVVRQLQSRTGDEDYWRLVNLVLRHAPAADRLVLLERFDPDRRDYYSFAVVVGQGGRYWCYTSDPAPTPSAARGPHPGPVWGECRTDEAGRLFGAMDEAGVWAAPFPRVHALEGFGLGTSVPAPWLVHAYRRGGTPASFIVESIGKAIDEDVVHGRRNLSSLPKDEPASVPRSVPLDLGEVVAGAGQPTSLPGEGAPPPSVPPAAQPDEYTKAYSESYPGRLVINGVLRVVQTERSTRATKRG